MIGSVPASACQISKTAKLRNNNYLCFHVCSSPRYIDDVRDRIALQLCWSIVVASKPVRRLKS
jgi:hypothetical protein